MDSANISEFIKDKTKNWMIKELLDSGIQNLSTFIGENFAGIVTKAVEKWHLCPDCPISQLREHAVQEMTIGLNKPFAGTLHIENLYFAKILFDRIQTDVQFEILLWKFRLLSVWSRILDNREIKLKQQIDELIKSIQKLAVNAPRGQFIEFLLEKSYTQINYFEYSAAKDTIDEVFKAVGIHKIGLGGALGKRTKFQQYSIPQLTLQLELNSTEMANDSLAVVPKNEDLPRNCKNADETLLEEVTYDERQGREQLNEQQTACILALAIWERHSNSSMQELGNETTVALLDEVIRQKSCWAIQTRALIERSKIEMHNSRRIERACAQIEEIAHSLSGSKTEIDIPRRFQLIFSSSPLPFWVVNKIHANILLSLGCVSDALRIFERLHFWDDVIKCYLTNRQPEKAELLLRKLLEEKEEPNNYCLLGDITNNAEYYQKAIELSDDQSSRARASMGKFLLTQKSYLEACKHYKRSIEIQPFQIGVWFSLGYSAMKAGDYQTSVQAYRRCVDLEPDHFEAWNNLAASYIRLNQKSRAQKILLEALKLSWENTHVWQNLLFVSVDIGDFKQAIVAIEKLMDMDKNKPVDELPLEIISTEIINSNWQDAENFKKSLLGIFARANSRQSLSPKLMRLYANLKRPKSENEEATAWSAYIQLLERASQREFVELSSSKIRSKYANFLAQLLILVEELQISWRIQKFQQNQIRAQLQIRLRPVISFFEHELDQECSQWENKQEVHDLLNRTKNLLN